MTDTPVGDHEGAERVERRKKVAVPRKRRWFSRRVPMVARRGVLALIVLLRALTVPP